MNWKKLSLAVVGGIIMSVLVYAAVVLGVLLALYLFMGVFNLGC